ncbi:uroporphyrinogen-III synthase [Alloalcanivorax profundimaris]|uniref:uroporphyrinogen-III synthase n=1 Tax=Alloalcanivorax profundimaris TaxID=2735259 RepID=UPI00188980EB|nr:uroporphyrinogen-III synthase [Alloalcanivorax profundimaris]MBF1801114.1 uroporphyrinogen-III synthase [Alloalcanivorax profundimaris]
MSRVLVTRPAGQGEALAARLRAAGHEPLLVPALRIEPLPLSGDHRRRLLDLDLYHAVFFVSANAARHALDAMADLWPQWPVGLHWLAVGESTAAEIRRAGLAPEYPRSGFNSEAVLALPCLADVAGKRILICRGDGGRDWLAARLRERDATVDVIPFYRRLPAPDRHCPDDIDTVMITSVEGWRALAGRIPARARVIAAGERVAAAVAADHAGPVVTAASAHDTDMLAALPG